jgi:hypothetical protein
VLERDAALAADAPDVVAYKDYFGHVAVPSRMAGHEGLAMIDTGTAFALALKSDQAANMPFESKPVPLRPTLTPAGLIMTTGARLDGEFAVAHHAMAKPIVAISSSMTVITGAQYRTLGVFPKSLPIVGGGVLKHFVVTIDQRNHLIRLRRHSDGPVTFPPVRTIWAAGEVDWDGDRMIVGSSSEAERQHLASYGVDTPDLVAGDEIVTVNGVPVADLTAELLEKAEELDQVAVEIVRSGERRTVHLPVITIVP